MSVSLESCRDGFEPHEWLQLLKMSALYAQWFGARVLGGHDRNAKTGEEILCITLARMQQGHDGYIFKDSDILFFYCLCRCCRKTVLTLREQGPDTTDGAPVAEEDDNTTVQLTEGAAVAFLQRRQCLEQFPAFIKGKKLKGKLRAYATHFPKYGLEGWEFEQIAKDLRVTPPTVGKYRSRLREFLEEFELQRERRSPT